jgi:hypothetical protein
MKLEELVHRLFEPSQQGLELSKQCCVPLPRLNTGVERLEFDVAEVPLRDRREDVQFRPERSLLWFPVFISKRRIDFYGSPPHWKCDQAASNEWPLRDFSWTSWRGRFNRAM